MKKISIIVPMYYEEDVVKECYIRLTKVLSALDVYTYEIIFVDDGSKDKTFIILEELARNDKNVKVLSFARNFGHQCAVSAGLFYSKGDAAIIIDSDLQDPPELFPEMIKLWEEGNEIVYAKRKRRKGESFFKLVTAKFFYKFLNYLADVSIPQDTGDFRLVSRKVIDIVNSMPEHNKFLRGIFSWVGFKQVAMEYEREARYAGVTKYPLKKMIKFALDGIISFSSKPLKIAGHIGLLSIIISFLVLLYSLIAYFFKLNYIAPGWTSIMVAITFFSGVQLVCIWIMSEYIGRIYDESKQRPQYLISNTINID